MTLKDILNADVASAGQWLGQGLTWWLDQLSAMTPGFLKPRAPDAPEAFPADDGRGFRLMRHGQIGERIDQPLTRTRKVVLRLSPSLGLSRTVELPLLSQEDTRRMVSLDLDRLMPFPAGAAVHALRIQGRDPARNRQTVVLAAAHRAVAMQAVEQALAFGLDPIRLQPADADLDLLPGLRTDGGERRRRLYWGATLVALIVLNLFLLVFRDVNEVSRLRDLVEEQRPAATIGLRLQRAAVEEHEARRSLETLRQARSPTRTLSAVNDTLPAGAWVHRLASNESAVRLTGYRNETTDVLGPFRASPIFAGARNASETTQPEAASGRRAYDIAANLRPPS